MATIGNFMLMMAMTTAVYTIIAAIWGVRSNRPGLVESSRRGVFAVCTFVTLAAICLWHLLLTDSFFIEYVANNSNRDLPLFFKFAAFWAGQAGSLLFWTWILAIFSLAVSIWHRPHFQVQMPYVTAILMISICFFLAMNLFAANPFAELAMSGHNGDASLFTPADGSGLNPLLQHPAMVIHPPILFLGYVGFAVPFAFALAALISGRVGTDWIKTTRRWALFAWFCLGIGILLGARWAYVELGWGGYWAWDPVENASLMPWLTGTAFLHSIIVQERRGMLKVWNMVLIILTYLLCIFGTFLTRSGVVSSVHAFAQSPIGGFFVVFLCLALIASVLILVYRLPLLRTEHHFDSMVSRESSFLFNNLVLVVAAFAVLWGTTFPILTEAVRGVKINVGAPFFNQVNIPIGLILLFLTAVGPMVAWRKTSIAGLKRTLLIPSVLSAITGILLLILQVGGLYVVLSFSLAVLATATVVLEFYRGTRARSRKTGENSIAAIVNLTRRNSRRWGGYIVHLGVVFLFVGFTGSAFNETTQAEVAEGDSFEVGPYQLSVLSLTEEDNANYSAMGAVLGVSREGKEIGQLIPEKRVYKASEQPTTEVAIHSGWREDLYTVFAGVNTDNDNAIIQVYVNPLVVWVWIGGLVLAAGTAVAFVPYPKRKTAEEPARKFAGAHRSSS